MSIPVTVLGGFLGAGKTTALNALLSRAEQRVGVLVNDFGVVNIDAALIAARQSGMVALSNGCVCCALGPDLGEGIARLAALEPPPEHVVIEASGVSDPWRIGQLARLETGVHLDAVLVLADAQRFPALLADRWLTDTLQRQVARADLVLLTHTDLATAAEIAATRAALRRLRADVATAAMPVDGVPLLLGMAHAAPVRFRAEAVSGHGFRQSVWSPPATLDRAALLALLDALPDSVLRLKGFCRLGPQRALHLVQRAGRRTTLEPWPDPAAPETFVLIGTPDMPSDVLARLCRERNGGSQGSDIAASKPAEP
ncbi:MAG TPA: CobW family GTP-binding protein [Acetobacteraceae bacterium]|nr:CobW family GTP-binding protein [Acetobacteraceae bacterium]